jgi:hypothetical protein
MFSPVRDSDTLTTQGENKSIADWKVEEVAEWLDREGFSSDVCDTFESVFPSTQQSH